MKKCFMFVLAGLIGLFLVYGSGEKGTDITTDLDLRGKPVENVGKVKLDVNFGKIPLYFIHNKGQVNKKAAFYAKTSRYTLWITKEGLVFDSMKKEKVEVKVKETKTPHSPYSPTDPLFKYERDVSRLSFIGAKNNPEMVPVQETKLKVNYFKGNDRSKWHCDVPTSQAVLYKNLYKNIDLKVYGIEKQIEYDWIVKPGGNPGDIRFQYKNVKGTRLDKEGNLLIETDFGELMHKRPDCYQQVENKRVNIFGKFKKIAKNTYGFDVGTYDKRNELIIDPVVLAYSTYLGGDDAEWAYAVAVDDNGCAYVAGYTNSTDFPILDQYMSDPGDNDDDTFVTKIDTTKSGTESLVYSTYLGGANGDTPYGIAADGTGNVYVAGLTVSPDFPIFNQYQGYQGGFDGYVTRLDTNLSGASSLIYSTYLGGESAEQCEAIAVDGNGHAYVTGWTWGADFPVLNQYQVFQGSYDAFVTRLDTNQGGESGLIYSTCLGGENRDEGFGIAVDAGGNAYVTGRTFGADFPVLNKYQGFHGSYDAFVTRLDTNQEGGASLIYSTYLGGESGDQGQGIAVDAAGFAYVAGFTESTDFPVFNQYQGFQGNYDAFVTRLDTNQEGGASLIYSTCLGGQAEDKGYGIALDANNDAYVTGYTAGIDFPIRNQYQGDPEDSKEDVFVTRLDTDQTGDSSLIYSTYLGGLWSDWGYAIAVDGDGNAYVTGFTGSWDFPVLNQYQSYHSTWDAFVTRFNYAIPPTVTTASISAITTTSASGGGDVTSEGGAEVTARGVCWSTSENPTIDDSHTTDGSGTGSFTSSLTNLIPNTLYYVRAYATNSVGTGYGNEVSFETLDPSITITSPDGGENWEVGSLHNITWTSDGVEGNVKIEYSTNNGDNWTEIIASTENDGSFPWTVPNVNSNQCLIRVSETDENPSDTSDAVFTIFSPFITVTSPNGGETWAVNSSQNITWTSTGTVGNVKIEYSPYNGGDWTVITASTANDGTHPWIVPDTVSNQCLIRVSESDGSPSDTSDAVFTIFPPSLTVTSPNGGENWDVGSVYEITWISQGTVGNVRIEYSTNGGINWAIITPSTENDGSYNWNIPATPSDNCLVRVSETDEDGGPSDTSDAVFSIISPVSGSITVRSPNGGETWVAGSSKVIKWNSTGDINNVTIKYSTDNGTTWKVIAQTTTNDGSYNWVVPDTVSDQCLVRVTANDNDLDPKPSDASDAVFSIVLPSWPTIRVTAPNGGEQLVVGSRYTITWYATNTREDVQIEYSINGGDTWTEIIGAIKNNGEYDWIVPDEPSDNCLVRVTEISGQPSDVSDEVFSIVPPSPSDITVTSPNGGETWAVGSPQEIKWTSTGGIDSVFIEYSKDYGTTWKTIVQTTPNNGSFDWTIPDTVSDECLVRITSNDSDPDPKPSDVSDRVFSIVPPASPVIRVIAPNGGEQLVVGSRFNITWYGTNTREDVKIEYSVNGGDTWPLITEATENDGDYDWIIPDTPSDNCLVRISETDGQPVDVSDAVFSIVPPLSDDIIVTAPNGGESWAVGSSQEIKWTSTGEINNVFIEYSTDNGFTWKMIVQTTANDGSFDWTIPDRVSDECLVRITAHDGGGDPRPSDVSDDLFSIVSSSPFFRVTSPNGGEEWEVGSTQSITWTSSGDISNVMIEYSSNNGNTWSTIAASASNSGTYDWPVPDTVSDECLVRVTANDGNGDPKPSDVSDEVFSIVLPSSPFITVLAPNGGEQLVIGSIYEITWFSTNSREEVKIEYSINGGESWTVITDSTENDGEYDWTVPDEPSETCLVRISEIDGQPVDISDAVFSIVSPLPSDITVLSPNGGENLEVNTEYDITWTSSGLNNVVIEYSTNNGVTWIYIDKVPADDGLYTWTVPQTPSENCLIRVSGADSDENPWDVSDSVFTIFDPSLAFIEVITPNGGESLGVGEEYYITWASTGVNNVIIEYSTDNGDEWITIIDTVSAVGGRYTWTVPGTPSDSCLIRISGTDSPEDPSDVSDSVFSITSN